MISAISVSSDIMVRYHSDCKIFNPFKINGDDSNILKHQDDLDPDNGFFNQNSELRHDLFNSKMYKEGLKQV